MTSTHSGIARDSDYYFPNADCPVLVQSTLFRIHRFMLERDTSMFFDMFKSAEASEMSDDQPLVLRDDSVEDFRALCWVLYALPLEIQEQSTSSNNISRLISLARISNKYSFVHIEEWCTKVILAQCSSGLDLFSECSAEDLDSLVHVAMCSGLMPLRDVIEDKWLVRLDSGELDSQHAFQVGERYNWRSFLGKLYYRHVLEISNVQPKDDSLAVELPITLTDQRAYCLLKGFHSLTLFWQNFSSQKIKIDMEHGCKQSYHHNYYCMQSYQRLWEQLSGNVAAYKSVDVIGKLGRMIDDLTKTSQLWGTMQPGCKELITKGLADLHEKAVASLPDHFLGPTSSEAVASTGLQSSDQAST